MPKLLIVSIALWCAVAAGCGGDSKATTSTSPATSATDATTPQPETPATTTSVSVPEDNAGKSTGESVEALELKVAALTGQIAALEDEIAHMETQIVSLGQQVETNQMSVAETQRIQENRSESASIAELTSRVDAAEEQIASVAALTSRVDATETRVAGIAEATTLLLARTAISSTPTTSFDLHNWAYYMHQWADSVDSLLCGYVNGVVRRVDALDGGYSSISCISATLPLRTPPIAGG